jgi:hypothetical protein
MRVSNRHAAAALLSRYGRDKLADIVMMAACTLRHPGGVVQNLLGLLVSLCTSGVRRRGHGGWVYYEHARGLGTLIPHWFGQNAITIGFVAFADDALSANPHWYFHEYAHYRQSIREGLLFLPRYLRGAVRGHASNPFEHEADAIAGRLLRRNVSVR